MKKALQSFRLQSFTVNFHDPTERKTRINKTLGNQILFNIQLHSLDKMVRLLLISRRTKDNYLHVLKELAIGKKYGI